MILVIWVAFLAIVLVVNMFLSVREGVYGYVEKKEYETQEKERKERERVAGIEKNEKLRLENINFWNSMLPKLTRANKEFKNHINGKYYLNYKKMEKWKSKNQKLASSIKSKESNIRDLSENVLSEIRAFNLAIGLNEEDRNKYNTTFLNDEINATAQFFDNVEGVSLDEQQRIAVLTDEDHNLIIAGAGSGKTTTIVAKVKYLVQVQKVKPEEILLIAFTNEAVSNMRTRIASENIENIEVKNFHKLGKDIIGKAEGGMPSVYSEINEKIREIFNTRMAKNSDFLKKVNYFFENSITFPLKNTEDHTSQAGNYDYLKNIGPLSINGEKVKSMDELKIANFLFKNGIPYKYEMAYEYETKDLNYGQYRPDFYLPDSQLYIEHFGVINEANDVPPFFANKDKRESYATAKKNYEDGIRWKRNTHKERKTVLVESYSFVLNTNGLIDLETRLKAKNVAFNPLSQKEIWEKMNETYGGREITKNFINLICSVINLMKSSRVSFEDLQNKNIKLDNLLERNRNSKFLEIFQPIYMEYERFLLENSYIDFGDMLVASTEYVTSGKYNKTYSYILVDEFQDSSLGRYELLRAILNQNIGSKLFCVGDDWQSIYRFSGSDISIFTEFSKYFGASSISKIETTFRFGSNLIKMSGDFIQANPNQSRKTLRPFVEKYGDAIEFIEQSTEAETIAASITNVLDILCKADSNISRKEILILARYNFNLKFLADNQRQFSVGDDDFIIYKSSPELKIRAMSVHKAKGLQADYVIITHCNGGKHGFPSQISDDPILQLMLSKADNFEHGEERRLFYVALSRAKEKVFILSDKRFASKFVTQLKGERDSNTCPRCENGYISKIKEGVKDGIPWTLFGCSNYFYGCRYTNFGNTGEPTPALASLLYGKS
jgi:DNA helicase IV